MAKRAQVKRSADGATRQRPSTGLDSVWLRACLIVVVGALAYANSLPGAFVLDDHLTIVENKSIRSLASLSAILAPERELPVAGRPVVNLSLALNYAVGGMSARGYHMGNIAFHLVCGLLLFGIVRRTLLLPALETRFGPRSTDIAFAAALIWTLHPLNTEVVNYVTQRTESLMAACYLSTLYCAIRGVDSNRKAAWVATAVVACALGTGSKESMATAPLMVVLYDRVFLFGSFSDAFRKRWSLYAGLAATWPLLAVLMWSGPRMYSVGFSTSVRVDTYLLNQGPMILQYLRLAVWPWSLVADYGTPLPLTPGDVWPQMIGVGLLFLGTVFALFRHPYFGFLGAWVFITLAPSSSFVPIATEVGAERRMYMPLMAISVMAVVALRRAWNRVEQARAASRMPAPPRRWEPSWVALLVLLSTVLALGTVDRNRDYRSPLTLAETVLARWPSGRAHRTMGVALSTTGRREEGIAHLREAVRSDPIAPYMLGHELFMDGKLDEAIGVLEEFVRLQPMLLEVLSARGLIGQALLRQGKPAAAADQFRMILQMVPSEVDAHAGLAQALLAQGDFDGAIAESQKYLTRQPNDVSAWTNLAIALASAKRLDEAIAAFARVAELDPQNANSHHNLAQALLEKRDFNQAATNARLAIQLNPKDAGAHAILGVALAGQQDLDGALSELRTSLSLDPTDEETRQNLTSVMQLRAESRRR